MQGDLYVDIEDIDKAKMLSFFEYLVEAMPEEKRMYFLVGFAGIVIGAVGAENGALIMQRALKFADDAMEAKKLEIN